MHRFLIFMAAATLFTLSPVNVYSQVISREAELKAKMVGVIRKLVTWPVGKRPTSGNPLKIGIMGDSPFVDGNGVDYLSSEVRDAKVLEFATAADFEDCHILVVARNADLKAALAKAKGLPILVITESPDSAKQGATINLVFSEQDNRIRLEINPKTALEYEVKIDRGLLNSRLVDIVR